MKLLLHIFAFVLLSGVAAFAQEDSVFTVSGRVVFKNSGNIPKGDLIKLDRTNKATIIKGNGDFTIKNVKSNEYILSVQTFGCGNFDTLVSVTNQNIEVNILLPAPECNRVSEELALKEVAKDSARLLLVGSISPIGNSSEDFDFEKEFKINYFDFGCTPPCEECILLYNRAIFKHLDQKYGKSWRAEIRPNVIGFKEYIAEN
jgi:hypothetical protein